MRPGRDVDHPPLSNAEVKGRVDLYLYSPYGSSLPVLGWTLAYNKELYVNGLRLYCSALQLSWFASV